MRKGIWFCAVFTFCCVSVCGLSPEELRSRFAEASPEYSPVPIWWWSGDPVEKEGIRYQLERIAAGGIHNAIILNLAPSGPLYGSAADEPPFLSEEWWELFGYAVETGKEVGVRIWFYDQLGFSGAGLQARVVRDHPQFRGINLGRRMRDVVGPAEVQLDAPVGATALAAFVSELVKEDVQERAEWIWDAEHARERIKLYFRRTFDLESLPKTASLAITCDNGYTLFMNGKKIGQEITYDASGWRHAETFDILPCLQVGKNVIAVEGENLGGEAGLLLQVRLDERRLISDSRFRVTSRAPDGWTQPDFDDSAWRAAQVLGSPPVSPWGYIDGIDGGTPLFGVQIRNVRNITDRIMENGIRVKVPDGPHRVHLFFTQPGGFDYQNPEACAALLDMLHGEMERRFGDELGKAIAGSFQDEFPALPRFSKRLPEEFMKRKGYDLLEKLPALYDDVIDAFGDPDGPTTAQVRCDANDVAARLCEEAFFIPVYEWHEKYGLLCGYDQTVRNADPVRGEQYYIDYFKLMRHYSAPGNDMDGDSKPHQSIADLYGRPRVWLEAFHSSGWGQTLEEINTLLNPWLSNGATLYDPHAIYYSIHGSYWEWAPPDTGWRQPYFAHNRVFADYVARLTFVLSQGSHVVKIGLLHPAATIHAYQGFAGGSSVAQQVGSLYWSAQKALRERCIDYIILDEDSIDRASVAENQLIINDLSLRLIILPSTSVLRGETMAKLSRFMEAGGKLIIVGDAPRFPANRAIPADRFAQMSESIKAEAVRLEDSSELAQEVEKVIPRDLLQVLPALHRRTGDRDFYFLLSDKDTPQTGRARFDINRRKLWETAAGRGERLSFTVAVDGIPERWDALSGEVTPLYNYRRYGGYTRVDLDLADTPAPLISIRPAESSDPFAIDSDLDIVSWERDPNTDTVLVQALQRIDTRSGLPDRYTVRAEFEDALYEGSVEAQKLVQISVPDPLGYRLEPTCVNDFGDFAWPPSKGPIPVEVRFARFHAEAEGVDTTAWKSPEFDDSGWRTVVASYGPRAEWTGPLTLPAGERFETLASPPKPSGPFRPAVYSLRLGIEEDPVFRSALGGKGRIPEEFIDLGNVKANEVYLVRTVVKADVDRPLDAVLRVGGTSLRRVFLNGEEIRFRSPPEARKARAPVTLQPGRNRLEILLTRASDGRIRLFYHFLPPQGVPEDPEWIWSQEPNPSGETLFTKTINIPDQIQSGEIIVALGDLHRIRVNGKLLADQGYFDPYFTSRAERYDITEFLQVGENRIEIKARDTGRPTGLLVDGLVVLKDGREVAFVSDASFRVRVPGQDESEGKPARIISGPSRPYMGDPALMLLRPRPHPLPLAGWLVDQPPPPPPFDRLVYSVGNEKPRPGWYRFRIPPGATELTLKSLGKAELYINGRAVPLVREENSYKAKLPDPPAPKRIAALRIEPVPGFEEGAAWLEPITFQVGPGRITYGSWDQLGLPHYSGGMVYETDIEVPSLPSTRFILDLGRVRGTAEVVLNGKPCGVRIWHPYRFDLTDVVQAGSNRLEIHVRNTLGPHFAIGHPSGHVFENHTLSGIFGPVTLYGIREVEIRLSRR